ncbi:hypothetical protein BG011_001313 [Mortierella polycephala]|uniref:Ras GEF n=1 Tax=Mortierella polycephala TaxID=41804 RepID=A0A9P6Q5P8_9FUNG|nr:hypothetical protein BG011_001313 [Mortierella polycephala]
MIPPSPDAGHPETIDSYFEHDHFGQSAIQTTSETPTEDDDDVVTRAGRGKDYFSTQHINRDDLRRSERRRSRSFCGPLSPFETPSCSPRSIPLSTKTIESATPKTRVRSMLISSSGYGVTISQPSSARTSCAPRRRRHSCVAPNTKEFHTLAIIFGWVTAPTSNMWSKRWSRQTSDTSSSRRNNPSPYSNENPIATYESDGESDHESCFPQGSMADWDASCDSSSSLQSPIQGPPSSNASLEHFMELSDMGLTALAGHVSPPWKSILDDSYKTGRPFSSRMRSGISMDTPLLPDIDSVNHVQSSNLYSILKFGVPPTPRSPLENHVGNDHIESEHRKHNQDILEHGSGENVRKSVSEHSSALDTTENDCLAPQSYPESPMVSYAERTPMSPLSCNHTANSGYMPQPCHPLDEPETTHSTIIQVDGPSCLDNCRSGMPDEAIKHARFSSGERENLTGTDHPRNSKKMKHATGVAQVPCALPAVPPRYPEINARAFDHPEDEGPSTIVYASLSISKQDSISGGYELQPIVAATIVKLIEKLTHQYGMDNSFIADFFLTYRMFMSPVQLCKYLIQRYLWALEQDTEERLIVRIRTFVVLRYWINNHFADDFLTSKSLRFQMAFFLNEMRFHPNVQSSSRDRRIIIHLTDFFKQQRRYYKTLAQQSMSMERKQEHQSKQKQEEHHSRTHGSTHVNYSPLEKEDSKSVEVERLGVSVVGRHVELQMAKNTTSDVTNTVSHAAPAKGRHRAFTLAGAPSRPVAAESHCVNTHAKPPLSKEFRTQSMMRQVSEGGSFITRERRLSSSSAKSNRSTSSWSTKMTMGISKLRQKSEDIYQQFVHPSNSQHKGDSRLCVCWTPAYTGITEHHALNTTRSFPSLRPSVVVTNVFQDTAIPPAATVPTSATPPTGHSRKSIKRLKSSLSLGLSPSTPLSSPTPSPTKNQFSGISSRHSRSSSNSSMGYHPNPDCPFHISCLGSVNNGDSVKIPEGHTADGNTLTTLKEALQANCEELGSSQQHTKPPMSSSIPPSPAWQYCPWNTPGQLNSPSAGVVPPYKPFILFYRSQMIAQQLCLLEQHFLEQVRWDELLEVELTKAGRRNRGKNQSMISGYLFKAERVRNGMDASNERSNMLCMWVASEVVSTQPIEDRVRVIEKFIRIAQKCHQYRNFNSLIQLVMGLGSSHLCGLRRTWSRVGSYEMGALQELQAFISPCGNWSIIRKAMNQVGSDRDELDYHQKYNMQGAAECSMNAANPSDASASGIHGSSSEHMHNKYLHHQVPLEKQGCIPFLGLFVFDLTHIAVSPPWYYPVCMSSSSSMSDGPDGANDDGSLESSGQNSGPQTSLRSGTGHTTNPTLQLQAPHPKDLQDLLPSGELLVHFHRYQLIAKTIKWFMAFQRRSQKYTFQMDNTLYSKCFLLRVLSNEQVGELADTCEND